MLDEFKNLENTMKKLDEIISSINSIAKKDLLDSELHNRKQKRPQNNLKDEMVMKKFIELIAFSNNAKSNLVSNIVKEGIFKDIFKHYNIRNISKLNSQDIIKQCWDKIKCIRFKYKIDAMIRCSYYLMHIQEDYGSFMNFVTKQDIPKEMTSKEDIEKFWHGFGKIQGTLINMEIPYFKNTTSLCHLLMDLGYDCVKPDKVVMEVCKNIGIVSKEKGDKNLREAVRFIQLYSVSKNMRPPVIDVYLLIYGGQEWAKQFI